MTVGKQETFVLNEVEVVKTGRVAEKPVAGGKKLIVVEVTPLNQDDGTWKKWVSPAALFTII